MVSRNEFAFKLQELAADMEQMANDPQTSEEHLRKGIKAAAIMIRLLGLKEIISDVPQKRPKSSWWPF